MNTVKLSNVSLAIFRKFLFDVGCTRVATSKGRGGHEKWVKEGLLRPITLPTHVDPVAEIVIKSNLRTLGLDRSFFEAWLLKNG